MAKADKRDFVANVLGMQVKIIHVKDLIKLEEAWGLFDMSKKHILLESSLKDQQYIKVLGHELIHAALFRTNLQIPLSIEESICDIVMHALCDNLIVMRNDLVA